MNPTQLSILNSLVTFAAEHVPAGLSPDEQEVAKIVGVWALSGRQHAEKTHDYKTVNSSGYGGSFEEACEFWANMGWRVVGVISDTRPGYAHTIVLERPIGVIHPDD